MRRAPTLAVEPGTATPIATGGMMPRGADTVVDDRAHGARRGRRRRRPIELRRAAAAGQFIAFAGSDIARGETVLRRGTR